MHQFHGPRNVLKVNLTNGIFGKITSKQAHTPKKWISTGCWYQEQASILLTGERGSPWKRYWCMQQPCWGYWIEQQRTTNCFYNSTYKWNAKKQCSGAHTQHSYWSLLRNWECWVTIPQDLQTSNILVDWLDLTQTRNLQLSGVLNSFVVSIK